MPKYLPAGLTHYVFDDFSKKSPPYHVTQEDISIPLQRLEVEKINGHQSVRGRGGVIVVMYETPRTGLSRPFWEREMDLQLSRHGSLRHCPGTPNQHRQTNRLYRWMRKGAEQRELSRSNGEWFLAPGYGFTYRTPIGFADPETPCFPTGPTFGTRATTVCGGSGDYNDEWEYLVRFLDDPRPI